MGFLAGYRGKVTGVSSVPNRKNVLRMDQANAHVVERSADSAYETAPEDWIFALDIGTRTVIGVVGVERQERYEILAAAVHEHAQRAMMDGQIHDIAKVASGAKIIKDELERKLGRRLEKVAIAAAGRVLKTCQVHVNREVDESREIDTQLLGALEMEGIRLAQDTLQDGLPDALRHSFHCVGYSVISYQLDDFSISNPLGHKGNRIGLEILATFLPHMVVDSLHTVMERIGLKVASMTLEPIAALNVAIPKDLRMLNLALVDVGAGTSDIAITKAGSVIGYAMAAVAGDEITEAIAQRYLVDFHAAERIKLAVSAGMESVTFTDILDNPMVVPTEEVLEVIHPAVENLARTIAERVKECNAGKPPNAVFLVGGGSQTPGLCKLLSELIGLPPERVAVRNRSIAKSIDYEGELLQGPECITPFGILVTANLNAGKDFFHVSVGGRQIRLFNARRMTVADALLQAGYVPDQLIGKSGNALHFLMNGFDKTVRGEFGKPSEISLNGMPAGLTVSVTPGDRIEVKEAERGADAVSFAGDHLLSGRPVVLLLAENRYEIPSSLLLNGKPVLAETAIQEGDSLVIAPPAALSDIVRDFELDPARCDFSCEGKPLTLSYAPTEGDVILCAPHRHGAEQEARPSSTVPEKPTERPASAVPEKTTERPASAVPEKPTERPASAVSAKPIDWSVQEKPDGSTTVGATEIGVDPQGADGILVTVNHEPVHIAKVTKDMMFVDIFNHIDFDLATPKGTVVLKLNGRDAGFTDSVKPGDDIEVYWRE